MHQTVALGLFIHVSGLYLDVWSDQQ